MRRGTGVYCFLGIILISFLFGCGEDPNSIKIFAATGLKDAIHPAIKHYGEESGSKILIQYGGSGTLLSNLRLVQKGDLFLSADWGYLEEAKKLKLVSETFPIAYQTPVIAVRTGNPHGVSGKDDLLRNDLKIGCANPESASIGKHTKSLLSDSGHWNQVSWTVMKPTVTDLVNDLRLGTLDVAVIWDVLCHQHDDIEAVSPPLGREQLVGFGLLNSSNKKNESRQLIQWVKNQDEGRKYFFASGFRLLELENH